MNKVRVYSIDNCPYCAELKNLLRNENIEFTDVNVNLPENAEEFKKLVEVTKSDDVPVIKIGDQLLVPSISFKSILEAKELTKKFLI